MLKLNHINFSLQGFIYKQHSAVCGVSRGMAGCFPGIRLPNKHQQVRLYDLILQLHLDSIAGYKYFNYYLCNA